MSGEVIEQNDDEHEMHHEFVASLIRKEQRKQETWDRAKAHVLGWGLVAFVGWLGTVLYEAIMALIKR